MAEEFPNNIKYLKSVRMERLSLVDQLRIKQIGRPTPHMTMTEKAVSKNREYKRSFSNAMFKQHSWLCGCNIENRLYCFPCLLYGGDKKWGEEGIGSLPNLRGAIMKHESSFHHMDNYFSLMLIGKTNFTSVHQKSIDQLNQYIDANREILNKIINQIKSSSALEFAVEPDGLNNNRNIRIEFNNFSKGFDEKLKNHFKSGVFQNSIEAIVNELLDCLLAAYHEEILNEIKVSDYISIIVSETTDVSNNVKLALIVRYVNKQGNLLEKLWGFLNPTENTAEHIFTSIQSQLQRIIGTDHDKLISTSYDLGAEMSAFLQEVQHKIKLHYKNTRLIHYGKHTMNFVCQRAMSQNEEARMFFASLSSIPSFFCRSPDLVASLDEMCKLNQTTTRLHLVRFEQGSTVNIVHKSRENIRATLKQIRKNHKQNSIIALARQLELLIQDGEFLYWLDFFHALLRHVDKFDQELKGKVLVRSYSSDIAELRHLDSAIVSESLDKFLLEMEIIRDKFKSEETTMCVTGDAKQVVKTEDCDIKTEPEEVNEPPEKRTKLELTHSKAAAAVEICDIVINLSKQLFHSLEHLDASSLFVRDITKCYGNSLPNLKFKAAATTFPVLHEKRLGSELSLIYKRKEMKTLLNGAFPLLQLFCAENVQVCFSEVFKLLKLVVTMPMSTTQEEDRHFPTTSRIRDFLSNTVNEDRVSALAVLALEKSFINSISNFNERVIFKFANQTHRRKEFFHKKSFNYDTTQ